MHSINTKLKKLKIPMKAPKFVLMILQEQLMKKKVY